MIDTATVQGRPAEVVYINDEHQPVAKDKATLIKVIFTDAQGGIVYLTGDAAKTDGGA